MIELETLKGKAIYNDIEYYAIGFEPEECDDKFNSLLNTEYYLKSEADKYINLLKDKANYNEYAYKLKSEELADTCRFYEDEIRHQKWKRCLAMAKVCFLRFVRYENYLQKLCASNATIEAYKFRMDMYDKWEKRWFKLAKKFKEVK